MTYFAMHRFATIRERLMRDKIIRVNITIAVTPIAIGENVNNKHDALIVTENIIVKTKIMPSHDVWFLMVASTRRRIALRRYTNQCRSIDIGKQQCYHIFQKCHHANAHDKACFRPPLG